MDALGLFFSFVAVGLFVLVCRRSYNEGRLGPSIFPEAVHLVCDQCGCSFSAFLASSYTSTIPNWTCACCISDAEAFFAENPEKVRPRWLSAFAKSPDYDPEGQRINQQFPSARGLEKVYKRDRKNMGAHAAMADAVRFFPAESDPGIQSEPPPHR